MPLRMNTEVKQQAYYKERIPYTFFSFQVLLVDGIVGVANSDGAKRVGGLGSTALDNTRTFVHPSRRADHELLEKQSVSGRDYCAAGLEGAGMKRRLVLQPELRELIARLLQHRPTSERLGERLCEAEYIELKATLGSPDVRRVVRFVPGEGEAAPVAEEARRRLLRGQTQMVLDKNRAMLCLLEGIETDLDSPPLWERWPEAWSELLYDLGAHDSDEGIIGTSEGLAVVRKLLLGDEASLEDHRQLERGSPILRRVLDAYGGQRFPAFFQPALHQLYSLTILARGCTGFGNGDLPGWVVNAIRPLDQAIGLQRLSRERGPLSEEEAVSLARVRALAQKRLPGVETLHPSEAQWEAMSEQERAVLHERLGQDEEGGQMHPLPLGHSFRQEQARLGHYALPGWDQKRGLPHYTSFESQDGKSKSGEEVKCATGLTVTEWDAKNTPGLVRGGGKAAKKGKQPHRSRGLVIFCCSHRVIYGYHVMLRGESPRDVFTVLYTRLNRGHLPKYLIYDNACQLRNYCMRRELGFFSDVTFLVDR
jgi:hypothetical protein